MKTAHGSEPVKSPAKLKYLFRVLLLTAALALIFIPILNRKKSTDNFRNTVRVALVPAFITSPFLVAKYLHYFEEEGIDLIITGEFSSGKETFDEMLAGKADISMTATTPVVFNSFNRDDFSIFVTYTTTYKGVKIITRTDRGIMTLSDLKGKRLGIVRGTISDILIDSILTYSKIALSDVIIVNLLANQMGDALLKGEVDAISVWEPHASDVLTLMPGTSQSLPVPKIYRIAINLAVENEFARDNPQALIRIVRALTRAVKYMSENEEETKLILTEILNLDRETVNQNWEVTNFGLSLDQLLLITMEYEADWVIRNGFTEKVSAPDYLKFIYFDALYEVNPDAVTIIRNNK